MKPGIDKKAKMELEPGRFQENKLTIIFQLSPEQTGIKRFLSGRGFKGVRST